MATKESTNTKNLRQPIVSVLGHVDSGKTTLLDYIRGSLVTSKEAGSITQMIGATEVPLTKIHEICGNLLSSLDKRITLPGLLFIDTPGHAAFTSLRKRGGSLSDIAILVVDVTNGIQPQTREAITILKDNNTPFVVALNKIDRLPGWRSEKQSWTENYQNQKEKLKKRLDNEIYQVMGDLNEYNITAERFDRVDTFQKKVAIVPISAETGEGIPELLMVLSGLSQQYMHDDLEVTQGIGKGTVLEVNDVKGLGTTIDIILHDGVLKKEDKLLYSQDGDVVSTPVKALLRSKPLSEIRHENEFGRLDEVTPAAGIKISAKTLTNITPGSPIRTVRTSKQEKQAREELKNYVQEMEIETQKEGVIVKADSQGSLEAVAKVFIENNIPISRAAVGQITKQDLLEASTLENEYKIVFGFNTGISHGAADARDAHSSVTLITSSIIYELVDQYEEWIEAKREEAIQEKLKETTRPGIFRIIPDHVFRSSNPAVVGVEIVNGTISSNSKFMNEQGDRLGRIKSIQDSGESIKTASRGEEVAISLTNVQVGRQIEVGKTYYTDLQADDYSTLQNLEKHLSANEKAALDTITSIKDEKNPKWKIK